MGIGYFDRDGNPIDLMTWAMMRTEEDVEKYIRVAHDPVVVNGETVWVSTVWIGLNMNWWPDRPPLIFETMVFGGEYDQYQERYATEAAAFAGHDRALAMVLSTPRKEEVQEHTDN